MKTALLIVMAIMVNKELVVESPAFKANGTIPSKYTCDGKNISPELHVSMIPSGTVSLALIMDDPDAPKGTFDHWIMWNIPVQDKISEDSAPGMQGKNGKGDNKYTGPCPPSGTHHYHFRVYALDTKLNLAEGSDKQALLKAIEGHILATGEIVGLYKR